ncbi:hypothetical protein C8R45DRAFT_1091524 [Mycena sanguinolenta]|nr:hypothetical protein C8R45DRAFT_1091524 [Mycena sanguinolenta]
MSTLRMFYAPSPSVMRGRPAQTLPCAHPLSAANNNDDCHEPPHRTTPTAVVDRRTPRDAPSWMELGVDLSAELKQACWWGEAAGALTPTGSRRDHFLGTASTRPHTSARPRFFCLCSTSHPRSSFASVVSAIAVHIWGRFREGYPDPPRARRLKVDVDLRMNPPLRDVCAVLERRGRSDGMGRYPCGPNPLLAPIPLHSLPPHSPEPARLWHHIYLIKLHGVCSGISTATSFPHGPLRKFSDSSTGTEHDIRHSRARNHPYTRRPRTSSSAARRRGRRGAAPRGSERRGGPCARGWGSLPVGLASFGLAADEDGELEVQVLDDSKEDVGVSTRCWAKDDFGEAETLKRHPARVFVSLLPGGGAPLHSSCRGWLIRSWACTHGPRHTLLHSLRRLSTYYATFSSVLHSPRSVHKVRPYRPVLYSRIDSNLLSIPALRHLSSCAVAIAISSRSSFDIVSGGFSSLSSYEMLSADPAPILVWLTVSAPGCCPLRTEHDDVTTGTSTASTHRRACRLRRLDDDDLGRVPHLEAGGECRG